MSIISDTNPKKFEFGKNLRSCFRIASDLTYINHGSYGCIPNVVLEAQRSISDEVELCPDQWYFSGHAERLWSKAVASIANFVNSDPKNLVFVTNVTTGVNAVLRSVQLNEGESILVTNQTYGAVHMTAQEVCTAKNCNLVVLNMTFPISDLDRSAEFYVGDIVEQYRNVLENNPNIRLAIIDYITSASAVKLPIKKLIQVCRQHNVLVLIDGAHAPGQIQLDLESLDADFFVGNLHKWLYCPRGSAILWVKPKYHEIINPVLVSWHQNNSFNDKFFEQGTLDYSPYLVVHSALKFYEDLGGVDAITAYNNTLVSWASAMLATKWKTEVLPVPDSMKAPFMACVRLPSEFQTILGLNYKAQDYIRTNLYKGYKIVAAIFLNQSNLWCRITANVYNTKDDYIQLGKAINKLRKDLISGELASVNVKSISL